MAHGGASSWLADVGDPLLRNWIVPVRNVSVDMQDCRARYGYRGDAAALGPNAKVRRPSLGTEGLRRKCTTLRLHGLREAEAKLLSQPWMGHPPALSAKGFPFDAIQLSSEPFAPGRCTSYVRGVHALFSSKGSASNFYVGNAGHLVINVINPLLAALAHSQPPMPAWLYWVTVGGAGQQAGKPSILYDAVGRLVDRTLSLDQAVAEVAAQGAAGRLCFEFATIGLEGRAGQWDAMMYDHPGRWGPRDIYRGVWAANRRRIRALYGLLPAPDLLPRRPATAAGMHAVNSHTIAAALLPAGVWVLRGGKSRSDAANADAIRAAFREEQGGVSMAPFNLAQRLPNKEGADMNAQRLPPLGAARGGSLDRASTAPLGERGVRARDLLELLASTDVLVGMFGAGLWNGLFLRPGSLLVELKTTYGYSGNENGRGVANANGLAYYMADVRRFQPAMREGRSRGEIEGRSGGGGSGAHRYPRWWLRRLAVELHAAWRVEAARSATGRGAEAEAVHDGRCVFVWPLRRTPRAPVPEGEPILTPSSQSTCYLDLGADGEWYLRKDSCCGGRRWLRTRKQCRPAAPGVYDGASASLYECTPRRAIRANGTACAREPRAGWMPGVPELCPRPARADGTGDGAEHWAEH